MKRTQVWTPMQGNPDDICGYCRHTRQWHRMDSDGVNGDCYGEAQANACRCARFRPTVCDLCLDDGCWACRPDRHALTPRDFEISADLTVGFARPDGWISVYVGTAWAHLSVDEAEHLVSVVNIAIKETRARGDRAGG